ncbi:Cytochrome P450 [Dillenia turbinata]|uniref:Cytochrome P450 n=1 Tax=Dillenia turbinata TaxID=194707 RepID=A0AAN8VJP4_9MAGN
MGKMPHQTITELSKIYGPLITLRLGTQWLVVGSSKEAAEEILKIHDRNLSGRSAPHVIPAKRSEINDLSMGWSFDCGNRWKYLRTVCRSELFSGKTIESQARTREEKVRELIQYISKTEGKTVNVGEIVFTTVYNALSNIMVSRDFISLEEESAEGGMKGLVRALMELSATPNISDFYPVLAGLDLQGLHKKSMGLSSKLSDAWKPIIEERRERGSAPETQDFLDVLLNNSFTDAQINQLLRELFAAGTDTSTSTIEWTMAELIKNPESMKRAREELTREIHQNAVKEAHLSRLPYLQACIKEALRLHPPAPFLLPRRALESCEVMNYTIPKDAQVFVNVWAIGRDPTHWNDPLIFKPERFLNSSLDYKGNDFEFLPFGAGRRICPGLPMAAKVVPLVLASLIHFFDWSLPHGNDSKEMDMSEKFGVTLQKAEPLTLIPKLR